MRGALTRTKPGIHPTPTLSHQVLRLALRHLELLYEAQVRRRSLRRTRFIDFGFLQHIVWPQPNKSWRGRPLWNLDSLRLGLDVLPRKGIDASKGDFKALLVRVESGIVDVLVLTPPAALRPALLKQGQLGSKGHDQGILLIPFLDRDPKIIAEFWNG